MREVGGSNSDFRCPIFQFEYKVTISEIGSISSAWFRDATELNPLVKVPVGDFSITLFLILLFSPTQLQAFKILSSEN